MKLFARDASYLIQRFRKSSAEEKEFIHFSFAETHPILSKDSETRPNTDTIRRNNASSRGGKAGATASPTRPGSPATPFENKAGRLGRVPAVRQRSGTERLVRFRRSSRSISPNEPPAPASAREAVRGRLVLQRHLHLVISYLYYINARRQGEAACRGGQYEPSLQVVHVRAGVVRQVEAHFAARHRDARGEGGRADDRTSHGAVVREVVPPVSHGVGLGATGGHAHRDGVVHARKRPLAAEDGRCRRQHGQLLQPRAILEEIVPRTRQPGGEVNGGQPRAIAEEIAPHARQSVGEVHRGVLS